MVTLLVICFCTATWVCVILWASQTLVIGDQMNLTSKTPRIELLLQPRQLLNLDASENRMAIECKNGVIWVTCAGEPQDHILHAGRRYVPKTKGPVVIEAIDEACLEIEESR